MLGIDIIEEFQFHVYKGDIVNIKDKNDLQKIETSSAEKRYRLWVVTNRKKYA